MTRSRLAIWFTVLVAWAAIDVAPAWAEQVGVRAARTNDYGQIVFIWQTPVTHDLDVEKRRLTVRFGRPLEASYQRVLGELKTYVESAQPGADGRSVSFRLKGDFEKTTKFVQSLKIFELAESLGGVESLVNHPETMTHASVPEALRKKLGIGPNLLRLSVGIESADDLIGDLEQAFKAI